MKKYRRGLTSLTNAVLAEPCVNKSSPENLEYRLLKNLKLPENLTLLLHVSRKCS